MVNPVELLGAFNSDHVPDAFYHADDLLLSHRAAAGITEFPVGNIVALFTEPDLPAHGGNGFTEPLHFSFILFQQVKYQPQCSLFADTRQAGKFVNGIFQK